MADWIRRTVLAGRRELLLAGLCFFRLLTVRAARGLLSELKTTPTAGPKPTEPRQLLADVSVIVEKDSGSGIQRVVRELLRQLIEHPPRGYEVRPVYATRWRGYRYAETYRSRLSGQEYGSGPVGRVQVRAGDVFLGMDLAAHILPRHPVQLGRWQASGVSLFFIVYDLLPLLHPEWFSAPLVKCYREWMRAVAIFADGVLCISRSVSNELGEWLHGAYGEAIAQSIPLTWFHLGSDIASGAVGNSQSAELAGLREHLNKRPSILMVGTVEPRKGYDQALLAFELLWRNGANVNLVIVGRPGWKVEGLLKKMRAHPELGDRLVWLDNATDETLCAMYEAADGLLVASRGEGFGLPIVEGAKYGTSILARDIPALREVAGEGARYFSGDSSEDLAREIRVWLDLIRSGAATGSEAIPRLTWSDSSRQLLRCLIPD